jgi:hypothetical protein
MPKDQLDLRHDYNTQMKTGMAGGATQYPQGAAFMTPMNMMYNDAMRAMYTAGGMDPNQWQPPSYMSWGQAQQMFNPQGQQQMPMQSMAGGGFTGMAPGMGMRPQSTPSQGQIPYWLMMPGMGGGQGQGNPPMKQ